MNLSVSKWSFFLWCYCGWCCWCRMCEFELDCAFFEHSINQSVNRSTAGIHTFTPLNIYITVYLSCKCKEIFIKIPSVTVTLIKPQHFLHKFEVQKVFDYSNTPNNCFAKWKYAHDLEFITFIESVRLCYAQRKASHECIKWHKRSDSTSAWPTFSFTVRNLFEAVNVKFM